MINMTVGKLKTILEEYSEDTEIVFQPSSNIYAERMGKCKKKQ